MQCNTVADILTSIMCMIMVSEQYCYPVVVEVVRKKEAGVPTWERLQEFPWVFMDLLFPFMLEYIFSWYVIWECVVSRTPHRLCLE